MQISELNLHDFLPADSLFYLSAGMQLEGAGTDIFSKRTTLTANAALNHLNGEPVSSLAYSLMQP